MRMATYSELETSAAADITFDDAPPKPPTFQIKLKTLWQQFQIAVSSLSPENIMQCQRECIKANLKIGRRPTPKQVKYLNERAKEKLTAVVDNFKQKALDTTKITASDTVEEMQMKVEMLDSLLDWLGKLFTWVIEKMKFILQKVKESAEWCFKTAKELFEYLLSMFKY